MVYILRNLATLTQNGVSLPKALGTLAEEQALERHRDMILALRRRLENGESFSTAMKQFGGAFVAILLPDGQQRTEALFYHRKSAQLVQRGGGG